jgi:hypothetical protein
MVIGVPETLRTRPLDTKLRFIISRDNSTAPRISFVMRTGTESWYRPSSALRETRVQFVCYSSRYKTFAVPVYWEMVITGHQATVVLARHPGMPRLDLFSICSRLRLHFLHFLLTTNSFLEKSGYENNRLILPHSPRGYPNCVSLSHVLDTHLTWLSLTFPGCFSISVLKEKNLM